MSWFAEAAGGESGTLRGHARVGSSSARFGWLMEAYSLQTDGFKMLTSGAPTGFDVTDLMGKLRINSDRSGPWYQELELKVGYTDEESSATYLGLTDADFAVNPLHRYPASASDLMTAEHSQVQLRHFWVRGSVDITTTVYRNDFARNWYKLQSVLGEGISSVLDAPDQYASALAVLRGGGSDPDALRVRANNRDYYAQGVQSTVGIENADGTGQFTSIAGEMSVRETTEEGGFVTTRDGGGCGRSWPSTSRGASTSSGRCLTLDKRAHRHSCA